MTLRGTHQREARRVLLLLLYDIMQKKASDFEKIFVKFYYIEQINCSIGTYPLPQPFVLASAATHKSSVFASDSEGIFFIAAMYFASG